MKKFLFLFLVFLFFMGASKSLAFDIPVRPQGFVNDYTGVLSAENKNTLENKISNFEKQTSNEIAIVIIPSLDGDTVENVAQNIFTKWSIGKKDKNNGVLVLVAIAEHQTRIQTGYGVEGDLTDLATSYIQSEIIKPAFRAGDYYSGLSGAVDKIIQSLGGNSIVPDGYSSDKNKSGTDWSFLFFLGFVILQFIVSILGRSKSWWGGGVLGAAIGGIIWFLGFFSFVVSVILFVFLIIFGLGLDFVVSRSYQKAKDNGKRFPWWIGGGGLGGGSGGGFGGFGGGMSGGGGSSGSW